MIGEKDGQYLFAQSFFCPETAHVQNAARTVRSGISEHSRAASRCKVSLWADMFIRKKGCSEFSIQCSRGFAFQAGVPRLTQDEPTDADQQF